MTDRTTPSQVSPTPMEPERFRDVPIYLWLVFASALMGWAFDAMDLNLLTLLLLPAMQELTGSQDPSVLAGTGGTVVALKLFAWGVGGIAFGVLTDKFGRARIMMITVAVYAVFTALSATADSVWEFALYQMIAGLGIGGEWAAGAALLAETWPERLRAKVMQMMQMGFALGFFFAALLNLAVGPFGWRWVFACGLLPVLLTVVVRHFVREPERWVVSQARVRAAREATPAAEAAQPMRRVFQRDLRRPAVVGILLGIAMMVGCWGGLTWIPSWIGQLADSSSNASTLVSVAFMLLNAGAILGYVSLMFLADLIGRRGTFFFFCAGALVMSLVLFGTATSVSGIMWLIPLYGFFAIGGFGIFAIYLPELFPTVVRGTGQGLAWNFARLVTGFGVLGSGLLVGTLGSYPRAAAAVSAAYVIGLVVIWFGPETKGQPLRDM